MPPAVLGLPPRRTGLEIMEDRRLTRAIECTCCAILVTLGVLLVAVLQMVKQHEDHVESYGPSPVNSGSLPVDYTVAALTELREFTSASIAAQTPPPRPSPPPNHWEKSGAKLHHQLYGYSPPPPWATRAWVDPPGHQLKMVFVIVRNGDRTALHNFPAFEANYSWPEGLGQLTPLGFLQGFNAGADLRRRYIEQLGFLKETWDAHHQIEAWSTDFERTQDTLNALLLGLYPPVGGRQSSAFRNCECRRKRLVNQPVEMRCVASCLGFQVPQSSQSFLTRASIHKRSRSRDWLLRQPKVCQVAKSMTLNEENNKAWKAKEQGLRDVFFKMAKLLGNSGVWNERKLCDDVRTTTAFDFRRRGHRPVHGEHHQEERKCYKIGLQSLAMAWDNLQAASVNKQPKLQIEDIDRDDLIEEWAPLVDWVMRNRFSVQHGKAMGGNLVREILTQMSLWTAHPKSSTAPKDLPRLTIYSAHGHTLLGLLAAMGVAGKDLSLPEFGDYITIELWQTQHGEPGHLHRKKHFTVKVDYQRRPLLTQGCKLGRCTFHDFELQLRTRGTAPESCGRKIRPGTYAQRHPRHWAEDTRIYTHQPPPPLIHTFHSKFMADLPAAIGFAPSPPKPPRRKHHG